jgi:hypothetical protein
VSLSLEFGSSRAKKSPVRSPATLRRLVRCGSVMYSMMTRRPHPQHRRSSALQVRVVSVDQDELVLVAGLAVERNVPEEHLPREVEGSLDVL